MCHSTPKTSAVNDEPCNHQRDATEPEQQFGVPAHQPQRVAPAPSSPPPRNLVGRSSRIPGIGLGTGPGGGSAGDAGHVDVGRRRRPSWLAWCVGRNSTNMTADLLLSYQKVLVLETYCPKCPCFPLKSSSPPRRHFLIPSTAGDVLLLADDGASSVDRQVFIFIDF